MFQLSSLHASVLFDSFQMSPVHQFKVVTGTFNMASSYEHKLLMMLDLGGGQWDYSNNVVQDFINYLNPCQQ